MFRLIGWPTETASDVTEDAMPETGETCDIAGWRFEVVNLDGRRVDQLLATRLEEAQTE